MMPITFFTTSESNSFLHRFCLLNAGRRAILSFGALLMVAGPAVAQSGTPDGCTFCHGMRLQDEIVMVNTRLLCGMCDPEALRKGLIFETYERCDESGRRRWEASDLESFLAFDSSVPTMIYVHGNQMTPADAKLQGLVLYRMLVRQGADDGAVRFVIFSWPSEKVGFLLRDVRVKALRTDPVGCQLAWLLDQMPPQTPVSLIGFSFGARIVTGSLHLLGGGSLGCGVGLAERLHPRRDPLNVVLVAAALHAHWLGEGQYHGLAMSQVDRMLLVNNCADLAMRYYHLSTTSGGRPQALGLCGPTCIGPEDAAKITMRDVSRHAGTQHDLFRYLCAPGAAAQVWEYTGNARSENPVAANW